MFRGDHPGLHHALGRARAMAGDLDHPRVGSEHLLLALSAAGDTVGTTLGRHGATEAAILKAVRRAAPLGAGAAADREPAPRHRPAIPAVRSESDCSGPIDHPRTAAAVRSGQGATAMRPHGPPLGLDAQAAYEASLRLALARRDGEHRREHLALSLVALDPGAACMLSAAGVDTSPLLADLASAYPPPKRNLLLRADRRLGQRIRCRDLIGRYQRTTGRTVTSGGVVAALIAG